MGTTMTAIRTIFHPFILATAVLAACTKPNPNTCCVTDAQCAALGAGEQRPCAAGQACSGDFTCVAAECDTSADCTDPQAPICQLGLCVGGCTIDDDCADVAGRPYCATEGVCVGCTDATQCPASAAICDTEDRACRGCERDDECASGVCIEADGVCAEEGELIHVRPDGADSGDCSRNAACVSLRYAVTKVTDTRNVVRVTGGTLPVDGATLMLARSMAIDSAGTAIPKTTGAPTLALEFSGKVVLGGLVIKGGVDTGDPSITVGQQSSLNVDAGSIVEGVISVANGGATLRAATLRSTLACANGTLSLQRVDAVVQAIEGSVSSMNCQLVVERSRFESNGSPLLTASGGVVTVENSLFVQQDEYADSLRINSVAPGSTFRFNTVVNTSGVNSDGQALFCDSSLVVTSNIFAYASQHPMGFPGGDYCSSARYSLFDDVAIPLHTMGEGNRVGDPSTFFVSRAAKDFHLAPQSPALDVAEPALPVVIDLEGLPRSITMPDMGAFEAP